MGEVAGVGLLSVQNDSPTSSWAKSPVAAAAGAPDDEVAPYDASPKMDAVLVSVAHQFTYLLLTIESSNCWAAAVHSPPEAGQPLH
jgi:hypothetical protein